MYFVNSASYARTEFWDTIQSSVISGSLCDKTSLYYAPRKALHKTICAGKSMTSEVVIVHQPPTVENPSLQPCWKEQLSDAHPVKVLEALVRCCSCGLPMPPRTTGQCVLSLVETTPWPKGGFGASYLIS